MDDKARLVWFAVGGSIAGFLPGADHKAAISQVVSSRSMSCGRGVYMKVMREGAGRWDTLDGCFAGKKADAALLLTWQEILAIAEAGCGGGYLEAYELAQAEWVAANAEARKQHPMPNVSGAAVFAAEQALIWHGCDAAEPLRLF